MRRAVRAMAAGATVLTLAQPSAGRTLEHRAVIDAPVADVWRAFTDEAEVCSWMCHLAEIDLRVGGLYRTNYNPNGAIGDATTITNQILAFEPERMLALRNVGVPEGFPWEADFQKTWSVIYFEPVAPDRTRVRIVGMGYGEGGDWDALYEFFEEGNAWTLNELSKKFGADDAPDASAALGALGALVGGEWIHESQTPDGGVFRVRNIVERGADGVSLIARGWLGHGEGMTDHGRTMIYADPLSGGTRFLNVNELGAVASGRVWLEGGSTVVWDWNEVTTRGERARHRVEMVFDPARPDWYGFRLTQLGDDGRATPMVDIGYERVDEAPARFRRVRGVGASGR
ncbi:MAG: SRPBCC domain-containing protein [Planctomycetota bacterium]|nr:MAG: SRPBCC domain-containing protein [Planctomycetota bacterium]